MEMYSTEKERTNALVDGFISGLIHGIVLFLGVAAFTLAVLFELI